MAKISCKGLRQCSELGLCTAPCAPSTCQAVRCARAQSSAMEISEPAAGGGMRSSVPMWGWTTGLSGNPK
eukprot:1139629-Pelagomonas_calceolata.AAC.1